MAYATLGEVKMYLGIETTVTTDNDLLTAFISRAQDMIDQWCGQSFEATANSSRYYDSTEDVYGDTLYLDRPLCYIHSITNGDGTTLAAASYVTEPRNDTPYYAIRLLSSSNVAWEAQADGDNENAITVAGKWAYSVMAPATIKQACVRLVAWMYRQKDTSADLDRPILVGDGSVVLPSKMPGDVQEMLRLYRRVGVG